MAKELSDSVVEEFLKLREQRLPVKVVGKKLGISAVDAYLLGEAIERGVETHEYKEYVSSAKSYTKILSNLPRSFSLGYRLKDVGYFEDGIVVSLQNDFGKGKKFDKEREQKSFEIHLRKHLDKLKLENEFEISYESGKVYIKPKRRDLKLIVFLDIYMSLLKNEMYVD